MSAISYIDSLAWILGWLVEENAVDFLANF